MVEPPASTTYADAVGEARCLSVPDRVAPLVVDLAPEARGDLEVALKQGVAVVSYDCKHLRLLSDCQVSGSYGYFGMTTKERVVQLQSDEELRANLPLTGTALASQLGAELERGARLDVALVMVGKLASTRTGASPK